MTKIIRICSLLYKNTRNTFVPPNLPVGADLRNKQARACAPCAQPVHSLCTPCALLVHSLCTPCALVLHKVHLVQPCAAPVHPIVFYRKHKKGCTGQKSNVRDEMPFLLCTKKKYSISILNPTTSFKMWVRKEALENIYFTLIVHSKFMLQAQISRRTRFIMVNERTKIKRKVFRDHLLCIKKVFANISLAYVHK